MKHDEAITWWIRNEQHIPEPEPTALDPAACTSTSNTNQVFAVHQSAGTGS